MTLVDLIDEYASTEYAAGNDTGVAAILNEPTEPGNIDRRHVAVCLALFPGVGGFIRFIVDEKRLPTLFGGTVIDESSSLWGLFCLVQTIDMIVKNTSNVYIGVADVTMAESMLTDLISAGALEAAFFPALKAGERKFGKAEAKLGAAVTIAQVGATRPGAQQ